ncbi:hypothetical protein ONZ45_g19276 [Pleurotus djamor]|nr:hypothetical protein ONZ45_g19276 [Pleurotus djamor]
MEAVRHSSQSQWVASRRVFRLRELLGIILRLVPADGSRLSAGLVCKYWLDSALDVLWYEVPDIIHWVKVLFPTVIDFSKAVSLCHNFLSLVVNVLQDFDADLVEENWGRFKDYGARIRILTCQGVALCPLVDAIVWSEALVVDLLPKLRILKADMIAPVATLLSGQVVLTEYCLDNEGEDYAGNGHLLEAHLWDCESLFRQAQLRKFTVGRMPKDCTARPRVLEPFFQRISPCLQELDIPASFITRATLDMISRMELLQSCSIRGDVVDGDVCAEASKSGRFPALRNIHLEASHRAASLYIEKIFSSTELKSVTLQSTPWGAPEPFLSLVNHIATRWPFIERISVECDAEPENFAVSLDSIKRVLSCGRLTSLTLHFGCAIGMGDDEYAQLLTALPLLQHLDLHAGAKPDHPPLLHLNTLLSVPNRCPHLEHLGVYMDFRLPSDCSARATVARATRLKTLNLYCSPLSGHKEAMYVLKRLLHPTCTLIATDEDWWPVHCLRESYLDMYHSWVMWNCEHCADEDTVLLRLTVP